MSDLCKVCAGSGWVCEDHPDTNWDGGDGCCGGAGMPCGACCLELASAGYVHRATEPLLEALRTIIDLDPSPPMDFLTANERREIYAQQVSDIACAAIAKATGAA